MNLSKNSDIASAHTERKQEGSKFDNFRKKITEFAEKLF